MSNESSESFSDMLAKHIQAGNVLVLTGKIEDALEKLLLASGRPISNKLAKRIFTGMGPLSSFSGKIEIAYFLELIDDKAFEDLKVIKDVRNIFAHTMNYVYFTTPDVAEKCRHLTTYNKADDPAVTFYSRALELVDGLASDLDRLMLTKALKEEPSIPVDDDD